MTVSRSVDSEKGLACPWEGSENPAAWRLGNPHRYVPAMGWYEGFGKRLITEYQPETDARTLLR